MRFVLFALILLGLKVRYSYSGDYAEEPGERW